MYNRNDNYTNRPKHIKLDNEYYFFTVRTVGAKWYLQPDKYKAILLKIIKEKSKKFDFALIAYAILNNHYHIIIRVSDAEIIPKFIKELNGSSAREINKADLVYDRKVWWNYYDHVIRNEDDFYKHLNYIHQNPIKHGIVKELSYKYSSYDEWAKKKGKSFMADSFAKYPVVDFKVNGDDF